MARKQPTYESTKSDYTRLLSKFSVTRGTEIKRTAARLLGFASRYKEIEKLTGIPWYFIAVIHYRESNCNFDTHLHNGDPLTKKTTHVPKGRPIGKPPFTWEVSALDALKMKDLHLNTDWSWERMCYELERYNGFGYRLYHPTVLSPYLWSGTDHYTVGKYVADGTWDEEEKDVQLGCVALLKELRTMSIDKTEVVDSSRKLTFMKRLRNAIASLVSSVMALDWLGMLNQVKQFATDHTGVILVVGAGTLWGVFKLLEAWQLQDYEDGRYTPSREKE